MSRGILAPEIRESLTSRWEPVYRSQLQYLVSWSTRGRKPVLKDRHAAALERLLHQVCDERGFGLVDFAAAADHVHVLLALRPAQSVASTVRELKGRTASVLLSSHPELRVWLRGNLLWDERYSVETVSAARVEKVQQRLRSVRGPDEHLARAS